MEKYFNKLIKKIKEIGIKKIVIITVSTLLLFFIILFISKYIENKSFENKVKNKEYSSMEDFESIREVAVYMGCDYIKEENSKENSFLKNIYLRFNKNLYDGDVSNQKFFENLSGYIAYVLNYSNYRLIDSSVGIVIEVICDKENRLVTEMIINGNSNYFADEDSKINISKYKKVEDTELEINSSVLKELIQTEWFESKVNFGIKESCFDKYDIYFDEGLEVRKIGKKVFNIVFTDKYSDVVVNDLKVSQTFEEVERVLGEPTFEQEDIIGYKSKDIYIFFEDNQISVYRTDENNNEDFVNLIQNMDKENDIQKIADKLTDIWSDYDEYTNTDNQLSITYSLKGVKLQYNVTEQQGVILYNNYAGNIKDDRTIENVETEDVPKYVYINTEENLVFLQEKKRNAERKEEKYRCVLQVEDDDEKVKLNTESNKFDYYIDFGENMSKVKFFSKENKYPKVEMEIKLNSYMWLDDYRFMYSVKNKGIYIFDLRNQKISTLTEGKQDYTFIEYNSGTLSYDRNLINVK